MPTANIAVVMMNSDTFFDGSGDANNTTNNTAGQNAKPPRVGVGLVCQRSWFGMAMQPQRRARRPAIGRLNAVSPKALAGPAKMAACSQLMVIVPFSVLSIDR
jgi:hypothetical protein